MPINYQLTLALKALREIQQENSQDPTPGRTLFPGLADVLEQIGSIPPDALLFGIASDGLPLLLNLRDASPGPLLVLADQGSGKTLFLQVLARTVGHLLSPDRVRYAVLTDFPDEWDGFESEAHCLGVYPAYESDAIALLYDLACQAETGGSDVATLLLFDGLDSALHIDPLGQENLRYLLAYGPRACIWPMVSINAGRAAKLPDWLAFFRTRVYGRISHPGLAEELTPIPGAGLNTLFPSAQFCLRQKSHWLRFWLPSL
jgi:hypothetical protein